MFLVGKEDSRRGLESESALSRPDHQDVGLADAEVQNSTSICSLSCSHNSSRSRSSSSTLGVTDSCGEYYSIFRSYTFLSHMSSTSTVIVQLGSEQEGQLHVKDNKI